MRYISVLLGTFLVAAFLIACIPNRHEEEIDTAFELCESAPDSALKILDGISTDRLSNDKFATFCLAYTMAQDKSGLDVDNDSLIRIAYNEFAHNPQSRYYSKSQYYMGKYYSLNDSSENAIACYENAKDYALQERDTATACLALERLSKEIIPYDQVKALKYARKADSLYTCFSMSNKRNQVFYKLQVCFSLILCDSLNAAKSEGEKALAIASGANDSISVSNCYRYISLIFRNLGDNESSLFYAKKTYDFWNDKGIGCELMLANAYYAADSLTLAEEIYKKIEGDSDPIQRSAIFINLQKIAIKKNKKEQAIEYGDSAYQNMGKLYSESIEKRNQNYEKLLAQEKEKTIAQHSAYRAKWLIGLVFLALCYIVFLYALYRKKAKERMKEEKERAEMKLEYERAFHEQELAFKEEQLKRELQHRDMRIVIMQKYLMEKIKIAQKINAIKDGKGKAIFSDDDWKEIEIFLENSEYNFVSRLRNEYSELREKDIRLMMLLRLKLSQKSIAEYYGIGEKAVKQKLYLYKEKVRIKDEKMSLREFIEVY